jgi:hypothetical protein
MLLGLVVLFYAMVTLAKNYFSVFIIPFDFYLDGLIKKLDELERTSELYRGLIEHTRAVLKAIFELAHTHRNFGDAFANIGAREPQFKASEAFTKFGEAHRQIDRHAITLLRTVKPVLNKIFNFDF